MLPHLVGMAESGDAQVFTDAARAVCEPLIEEVAAPGGGRPDPDHICTSYAERANLTANTELAQWTAGGPLARAWRAFLYRRGRT